MHTLKSGKKYKIVTIQVAAPADLNDAQITDGLNEMLHAAVTLPEDQTVVADWRFLSPPDKLKYLTSDYEVNKVGKKPEEGEAFVGAWPTFS